MNLVEFLRVRIEEAEEVASIEIPYGKRTSVRLALESLKTIINFHEDFNIMVWTSDDGTSWAQNPITPMTMAPVFSVDDNNNRVFTAREYRENFKHEPPYPIFLTAIASIWADHPGFDPAWMNPLPPMNLIDEPAVSDGN